MRWNTAFGCALVITGCVTLLTVLVDSDYRAVSDALALRETRAVLANTALRAEHALERVKKDILTLNRSLSVGGGFETRRGGAVGFESAIQSLQPTMISLLRDNPDYARIRIIDGNGREQIGMDNRDGGPKIVPPKALTNRTEFPGVTETVKFPAGRLLVSLVGPNQARRESGPVPESMLRVASPLSGGSGRNYGVITIDIDAARFAAEVIKGLDDLQGQVFVIDQDGDYIVLPQSEDAFGLNLNHVDRSQPEHHLTDQLRESTTFVEIAGDGRSPDDVAHVHGFRKILYDPLDPQKYIITALEMPFPTAFEPVLGWPNRLFVEAFTIALLGSVAVYFWAGRATRRLREIALTAGHIAQGQYDKRVDPPRNHDEFHELAAAFNRMVDTLVTSERRLANIVDAAADAIISVDQQQRIITFNNTAAQVFGYAPGEILGQPLERLLPVGTAAVHREHFLAYGQEEGSNRRMGSGREVAGRRSDGSTFPAEVSISKTVGGINPIFTAILRDITDRNRAETERAELVADLENAVAQANRSRAQLEAVFQAMEDGIAVLDMQRNLILVNGAEVRITGFASPEQMTRNLEYFSRIFELTEPDGSPVPLDEWPASRCLRGETIHNQVLHGRRKDTRQEWIFRFSGSPIYDSDGQQILAAIVTRDITEFKRAENEILRLNAELEVRVRARTAELEAANKELEAFSYSVSHDLRAPLRAIDGFSLALLEDYGDQLDATGQQYLRRVRAGSVRMADLIDDMLQLSRVTRAEIRHQTVDLSALAESVFKELRTAEPDRSVAVAIQPELRAQGDPNLLRIALTNLFSNAWKFTKPVPAACIELGSLTVEGEPGFYVRDNGVGFDMNYCDKLFGAFQRLHTENEFPGTGIGLAIVQRIINRHCGRVWAESVLNRGSTFYFTLPLPRHLEGGHDVHQKNSVG